MMTKIIFYNYNYLLRLSCGIGNFQTISILTKGDEGKAYRREITKSVKKNRITYNFTKKFFGKMNCNSDGIIGTVENIRRMVLDIENRGVPLYVLKYYTELLEKINKEIDGLNLLGLDIDHI